MTDRTDASSIRGSSRPTPEPRSGRAGASLPGRRHAGRAGAFRGTDGSGSPASLKPSAMRTRHPAGPGRGPYPRGPGAVRRPIERTSMSSTEDSRAVGYNSLGSFTNCFTAGVGVSPSRFLRLARNGGTARRTPLVGGARRDPRDGGHRRRHERGGAAAPGPGRPIRRFAGPVGVARTHASGHLRAGPRVSVHHPASGCRRPAPGRGPPLAGARGTGAVTGVPAGHGIMSCLVLSPSASRLHSLPMRSAIGAMTPSQWAGTASTSSRQPSSGSAACSCIQRRNSRPPAV